MPSLSLFWLCDHFYQPAGHCSTTQSKSKSLALPFSCKTCHKKKKRQGTLLRSYARSEAHSKRWSGSVNKAWESTTHVSSSGMLLRSGVPSQVLPVEWAGVSCYLSHSLQKHTSHRKIKHSPHFVTSSSSFSPLCSPSVLPGFHQFQFCLTTRMWNAKSEHEHCTSNSVTEKFLRSIGSVSRMIHLECRVACIHTLFIFLLLQNLEEPARD